MSNSQAKQVAARKPAPTPDDAVCVVQVIGEYVTKAGDAIGDIVEMCAWPASSVPVDVIVDNGALGASATLDVGVMSGDYGDAVAGRTMGTEFIAAGAAAAAGVLRRNKVASGLAIQATDKSIGIKFQGANPAAGQTIRMVALFAPNPGNVAVA